MKIKFSSIEIKGDLFPHSRNEVEQYKEISYYLYETLRDSDFVEITIDDNIINLLSFLTSKMIESLTDNIYTYLLENKGARYLSGDITTAISESITYATLNTLYKVKFINIVPLRTVKYLGIIADAVIDLSKEEELKRNLKGSDALLFINIRASMSSRSYYLVDKLAKSIQNLEIVRYPDNYGLISVITKDNNQIKESFIFIKP